jgi:hypothetical protein
MTKQLLDLTLDEISGVDHPASLVEGWLVSKSAMDPITASLVDALTQTEGQSLVSELTVTPAGADAPEEQILVADDSVAKALDEITKELADAKSERETLRKERDDLTEAAAIEKSEAKVADWGHVPSMDDFAPVLRSLNSEQSEAVVRILDAAEIVLAAVEGTITKELGTTEDGDSNDLEATAKALVANGTHPNFHTAIAAVAEANPAAYAAQKEA